MEQLKAGEGGGKKVEDAVFGTHSSPFPPRLCMMPAAETEPSECLRLVFRSSPLSSIYVIHLFLRVFTSVCGVCKYIYVCVR